MSQSTHQIRVKGVDQTGGAFGSIRNRAKATGASIRSMMGSALAAAGAYMGVRKIGETIGQLGQLSDLAMKSGMSVETLTRSATAFQVAGLNISVDSLARSMQYLQKTTGESGEGAFERTLKSIAGIGDAAERNQALIKAFGRSGLELQPLVNGGAEAIEKFATLRDLMPGVSSASANSGDAIADAMTIAGKGTTALWQNVIGKVCALWGEDFPGGVRAGALNAVNYLEYFCKRSYNLATTWGAKIGLRFQSIWNWASNGYSWSQAMDEYNEQVAFLESDQGAKLAQIDAARAAYVEKLKSVNVDDLANVFGKQKQAKIAADAAADAVARIPTIRNDLIKAGNETNKLYALGPQMQSESKKQTTLLEKIAKNTEQTADNTEQTEEKREVL